MSVLTDDAVSPCVEGDCSPVIFCIDPGEPLLLALLGMQRLRAGLSIIFISHALGTSRDVAAPKIVHT